MTWLRPAHLNGPLERRGCRHHCSPALTSEERVTLHTSNTGPSMPVDDVHGTPLAGPSGCPPDSASGVVLTACLSTY